MLAVAPRLHHVVQAQAFVDAPTVTPDFAFQHRPAFFFVVALEHGCQRFLILADRDVGDEAQPPLVDAHQRHFPARQFAGNAQHGAVTAHHHGQVTALAHFCGAQRVKVGNAHGVRGFALERDLQALADQEMGDLFQHRAKPQRLVLANDHRMSEPCTHENDYTIEG
jgi:hypothetical protein